MDEKKIDEIHKMAQIALGKQVDKNCTKWAIKEGFFDNFEALYDAGYRKESDTAKEICALILEHWEKKQFVECDWLRVAIAEKYGVDLGE